MAEIDEDERKKEMQKQAQANIPQAKVSQVKQDLKHIQEVTETEEIKVDLASLNAELINDQKTLTDA